VVAPLEQPVPEDVLLLQATFLPGTTPRYVLTLTNLSPWAIDDIHILDRFFDPQSDVESSQEWAVGRLEPGASQSTVLTFVDADPLASCHQIEMNWAGGWSAFFIDQGDGDRTTVWNVPLVAEMAAPEEPEVQVLSFDEPVGRSKLGLHVTRNSAPEIMAFVEDAQPAVLVGVGDLGWLADAKAASPGTMTLGRFEETGQVYVGNPLQRAEEFVVAHAARYLANPQVDYWLGWNEPAVATTWQMTWYATFEAERARLMADLGLKVAVGNFSTGTPEAAQFAAFVPAIEAAKTYGGVLALHEYSAPTMMDGAGMAIPGHEAEAEGGTLTLRYRYWYEHYLAPSDLIVPLVITEAGVDGGVLRGQDPAVGGWRDFGDEFPQQTLASYVDQVSWYDDQLRRDPYVVGFALFNAGDADGHWATFDVTSDLDAFVTMAVDKQ
jgi:hypothetical protein